MVTIKSVHYTFWGFEIGIDLNLTYLPEPPVLRDASVLRGPWVFVCALPIPLGCGSHHDRPAVLLSLEDSEQLYELGVAAPGLCYFYALLRPRNDNRVLAGTGLALQSFARLPGGVGVSWSKLKLVLVRRIITNGSLGINSRIAGDLLHL